MGRAKRHLPKQKPKRKSRRRLQRARMLRRDRFCGYCGERLSWKTATIDHLIPRSRGGPDIEANMALACRACNEAKGQRLPLDFIVQRIDSSPRTIPFRRPVVKVFCLICEFEDDPPHLAAVFSDRDEAEAVRARIGDHAWVHAMELDACTGSTWEDSWFVGLDPENGDRWDEERLVDEETDLPMGHELRRPGEDSRIESGFNCVRNDMVFVTSFVSGEHAQQLASDILDRHVSAEQQDRVPA